MCSRRASDPAPLRAAAEGPKIPDRFVQSSGFGMSESQRRIEVGQGLSIRIQAFGFLPGDHKPACRLVVPPRGAIVMRRLSGPGDRFTRPRSPHQGLSYPPMQQPPPGEPGALVNERPDDLVREVVAGGEFVSFPRALFEEAARNQLLERGDRFVIAPPTCVADGLELERRPYDRGRGQ